MEGQWNDLSQTYEELVMHFECQSRTKNEMGRDALWIMAASVYNSAEKILAKSGECPCIPLSEKGYVSYTIHK